MTSAWARSAFRAAVRASCCSAGRSSASRWKTRHWSSSPICDLDVSSSTFAGQRLRQEPKQAQSREHLRDLLQVASGGVIFTTIQKFRPEGRNNEYPLLSERHNIVFIADEAHRSQYGFDAHMVENDREAYIAYGFAKYVRDALPNASFIGFTGTPIESADVNKPQVFGDYIDIYDIRRAVEDGATVPIYYEARLARLQLKDEMRPQIDPSFEEITEGEEDEAKERLKTKWAQLEAMVGTSERSEQVAGIVTRSAAAGGHGRQGHDRA